MLNFLIGAMRRAVHFNDQLSRENCEIGYIWPDWMLAAEIVADLAQAAQVNPEHDFGLRHFTAK